MQGKEEQLQRGGKEPRKEVAGKLQAPTGDKPKREDQDGWRPEGCRWDEAEPGTRARFTRAIRNFIGNVKCMQLWPLLSCSSRRPRGNTFFSKSGCQASSVRAHGHPSSQELACSCLSSCLGKEPPTSTYRITWGLRLATEVICKAEELQPRG